MISLSSFQLQLRPLPGIEAPTLDRVTNGRFPPRLACDVPTEATPLTVVSWLVSDLP
jgi:hypothetical protein